MPGAALGPGKDHLPQTEHRISCCGFVRVVCRPAAEARDVSELQLPAWPSLVTGKLTQVWECCASLLFQVPLPCPAPPVWSAASWASCHDLRESLTIPWYLNPEASHLEQVMQYCSQEKQLSYKPVLAIFGLCPGNFPSRGLFLKLLLACSVHRVLICRPCCSLGRESRGGWLGCSQLCWDTSQSLWNAPTRGPQRLFLSWDLIF